MAEYRHDQLVAVDHAKVGINRIGYRRQFALLYLNSDGRLGDRDNSQLPVEDQEMVIHFYVSSVDNDMAEPKRSDRYAVGDDLHIVDLGNSQFVQERERADVHGDVLGARRGADPLRHDLLSMRAGPEVPHDQRDNEQDDQAQRKS